MADESKTPKTCVDCQGEMREGYVPDHIYTAAAQPAWVEGKPEPHWLTGVRLPKGAAFRITTWRCENCGVLKSYAHKKAWLPVKD